MIRIITESQLRQYWDQLGLWQWEYYVQNISISKNFIRQMYDKFDLQQWNDILSFQEKLEQRQFEQFKNCPLAKDILFYHPELSNQFTLKWFGFNINKK